MKKRSGLMLLQGLTAAYLMGMSSIGLAASNFPSYLTDKYCNNLKLDFMSADTKSLQAYREKQLAKRHPGGMNNIRKFIDQRQEWLQECENYLSTVKGQHLFRDEDTTTRVFQSMTLLSSELDALVKGVTYSSVEGDTSVVAQKFDQLIQLIDEHDTLMRIKGQMVYR